MQSSKATNKSGTQDIDICVHTVNQLEKGYCLTSLFNALVKHPISIFGGPNEKQKQQRTTIGCFGKHIPHSTKAYTETERERWRNSNSCKCSTEQHSTPLHKVNASKITICLATGKPLNTTHNGISLVQ